MNDRVLRIQRWNDMGAGARAQLLGRGGVVFAGPLREGVVRIIEDVRVHGDEAVCRALRDFDRIELSPAQLRVSDDEFAAARAAVSAELLAAIRDMVDHIRRFNEELKTRVGADWRFESEPGLFVGEKVTPIASAGLFCPSGKASYPSVLAQIGTPAVVAGVPRTIVVTPPIPGSAGAVDPATLVVAQELGLRDVFRVNGPAGVAALAFGTEQIPAVVKVVGPGSPAVTCAQVEVQRYGCATMMLLGPSESLIIADATADPVRLAADLLNEAEHGTDSSSLLITADEALVAVTEHELARQLAPLPAARAAAARAALADNGGCVLVESLEQAAAVANAYGPEHLQLAVRDPEALLELIDTAGEVLLGQDTPFSAANFLIGCPASLPTGGFARVSSGITVDAFLKRTAVARADERALRRMSPSVLALADHEGFPAHANSLRMRFGGSR